MDLVLFLLEQLLHFLKDHLDLDLLIDRMESRGFHVELVSLQFELISLSPPHEQILSKDLSRKATSMSMLSLQRIFLVRQ